jgi:hypothetical protein
VHFEMGVVRPTQPMTCTTKGTSWSGSTSRYGLRVRGGQEVPVPIPAARHVCAAVARRLPTRASLRRTASGRWCAAKGQVCPTVEVGTKAQIDVRNVKSRSPPAMVTPAQSPGFPSQALGAAVLRSAAERWSHDDPGRERSGSRAVRALARLSGSGQTCGQTNDDI